MASFSKSIGSAIMGKRDPKLPPLPPGLGLPAKSNTGYVGRMKGQIVDGPAFYRERDKAEAYNKAFAELLNNQAHLSGMERNQIYDAYSDKFIQRGSLESGKPLKPLTNYGKTISQAPAMTPEQVQAAQQAQFDAQQPAQAPAPAAQAPVAAPPLSVVSPAPMQQALAPKPAPTPAPAPTAAPPATVGPVPQPQTQAPVPADAPAAAAANIVGTKTTGAMGTDTQPGRGRGRRGRMATLLSGLGGTAEQFGG